MWRKNRPRKVREVDVAGLRGAGPLLHGRVDASFPWGAPPSVQERDEISDVVVGSGRLQPRRESVDRDAAGSQLVGEDGTDGV